LHEVVDDVIVCHDTHVWCKLIINLVCKVCYTYYDWSRDGWWQP